jgi:N-methylhydantoinase B
MTCSGQPRPHIDPLTLAVVANGLLAAAEAMGEALVRSAFSPNIKERRDCSTAVFDAQGRLLAQAEHIPLHLGSMLGVVDMVLRERAAGELSPGDAFVSNDPYLGGGTHLPDVTVASPFFFEGRLSGFVANVAHHADIGSQAPGGISGDARSIDEEGLRLPVTRLATAGGICADVLGTFASRCRMPEQRRLDLVGQLAANRIGSLRLQELFGRHGPQVMFTAADQVLNATERRLRSAVSGVPDGVYEAEDQVEGVQGEGPIRVRARLQIQGDGLSLDFSGSGPPSRGAINVPHNALLATVYYAVKASLDPGLRSNAGLHRAIEVSAPQPSVLSARPPSAVGARTDTCQRVAGCIIEAFARALPGRLPAPSNDASTAVVFSGVDPRSGRDYVYVEAVAGGAGGGPDSDGMDGVQVHITNTSNLPVECLEHAFPLLVERYEFLPDSGGPGEFRGGLGLRRTIRVTGGEVTFSAHGDRHQFPARGAEGGLPGGLGAYLIAAEHGPARPPERRDPERLATDRRSGVVSSDRVRPAHQTGDSG